MRSLGDGLWSLPKKRRELPSGVLVKARTFKSLDSSEAQSCVMSTGLPEASRLRVEVGRGVSPPVTLSTSSCDISRAPVRPSTLRRSFWFDILFFLSINLDVPQMHSINAHKLNPKNQGRASPPSVSLIPLRKLKGNAGNPGTGS